jgi:mono/diheme cytochrome c family protein
VSPAETLAAGGSGVPLDVLISQGAKLFFEGTFGGNGRTCGTCHPARNNFTIDVPFINTLPPNDPLFVAETNPALAELERPALMRGFGLILENVDGLEDPTKKFVMRGVPHTLGLQVSMTADVTQTPTPAEMTGWSGDGAPGTGSLREFAIGAVTQHFTKTLARVQGHDFRLPSEHQLDAMEAFQLSLGRSADFNLGAPTFNDEGVDNGRDIFLNGNNNPNAGGVCAACHADAGALFSLNNQNRNFNTNVEDVFHVARNTEDFPPDGGFGRTPTNSDGTFGNRAFNTASVVEAADTPPFFHNNVVETLPGVVAFYEGPEFNTPRDPAARFDFTEQEAQNLVNFMRAINAVDNINVARRELEEILALSGNPGKEIATRLETAFTETGDAIEVLNQGGLFPTAVAQLTVAQQRIAEAQQTSDPALRTTRIQQAIAALAAARNIIGTFSS